MGKQLARILYTANATVYLACRTESKALDAIKYIEGSAPDSKGRLEFLHVDLGDLTTIKPAVKAFTAKEDKLDVLFNNAGVMVPPKGQRTAQGHDMQMGTNCLGHFALTELLTPTLKATVPLRQPGDVRVVWVSSMAGDLYAPTNGVDVANLDDSGYLDRTDILTLYGSSKAGNYLQSVEYARRHTKDGIVSVVSLASLHPAPAPPHPTSARGIVIVLPEETAFGPD